MGITFNDHFFHSTWRPPSQGEGDGARGQIPSQAHDPLAPCGAGPKRRERGGLVGRGSFRQKINQDRVLRREDWLWSCL